MTQSPPKVRTEEEIIRANDEVVASVGQELRGPLANIIGFTEMLHSRPLSEAQRKVYLGVMLRESRRLSDLVNEILQLQRLEGGREDLDIVAADVHALIRRAVASAGPDESRPIAVFLPVPMPMVMADTDAILQVLGNFISNARKYSPDGGVIRIGARVDGDTVEIHIKDEGLGISAEALPHMFGKFFRVDSGDRRLTRGTGLGLAINRTIVEAHGGSVEAHSAGLGKGSRFRFTLPVAGEDSGTPDVLVVEDDPSFARLLAAEFRAGGLTILHASDAETAEHLLERITPRAIVLDLVLPGLQGEEFLDRLGSRAGREFPIVVLTVKNMLPEEIAALERAGAIAVLPKEAGAVQATVDLIARQLVPVEAGG